MHELITQNWLLSGLTPVEAERLDKAAAVMNLPDKSRLIENGQPNQSLWIIIDGTVRIEGSDVELGQGDIIGEMSWLDGHPASATAVVSGHARVIRILFEDFEKFLESHPEAHIQILRKFAINLSFRLRG